MDDNTKLAALIQEALALLGGSKSPCWAVFLPPRKTLFVLIPRTSEIAARAGSFWRSSKGSALANAMRAKPGEYFKIDSASMEEFCSSIEKMVSDAHPGVRVMREQVNRFLSTEIWKASSDEDLVRRFMSELQQNSKEYLVKYVSSGGSRPDPSMC